MAKMWMPEGAIPLDSQPSKATKMWMPEGAVPIEQPEQQPSKAWDKDWAKKYAADDPFTKSEGMIPEARAGIVHGMGMLASDLSSKLAMGTPTPGNIASYLSERVRGVDRDAANKEQQARRNQQFEEKYGESIPAKVGEFIGRELPTFAGGYGIAKKGLEMLPKVLSSTALRKAIAINALTGGIVGGVQAEGTPSEKLQDVAYGVGVGGVAGGLGRGAEKFAQLGAKAYAQSSLPGLIKKATEKIRKRVTPERGAKLLKSKHDIQAKHNTKNWDTADKKADLIDTEIGKTIIPGKKIPAILGTNKHGKVTYTPATVGEPTSVSNFNNKPYLNFLNNFQKRMAKSDPAAQRSAKDAIGFAKDLKAHAPESFKGVMTVRKDLNQQVSEFLKAKNIHKQSNEMTKLVLDAKENLIKKTLPANASKIPQTTYNNFINSWEKANKSHQKLQEFYKGRGATGEIKENIQSLKNALTDKTPLNPTVFPKHYMPQGGDQTIDKFQQLGKVLGSQKGAKAIVRSVYLRKIAHRGAQEKKDIALIYSDLSKDQRQYVFGGTSQKKILDVVEKTRKQFGQEETGWKHLAYSTVYHSPVALGTMATAYWGLDLPWETSLMAGLGMVALGRGGQALIAKKGSPKISEWALKRALTDKKNRGRLINLGAQTLLQHREAVEDKTRQALGAR